MVDLAEGEAVFRLVQGAGPPPMDLDTYDSWFETTKTPAEYRWGRGL
ncbi:MAG TPA: hypothetical protein VFE45_05595 [Coriobacteriia bacterium]|nr:hypothetical protein [Coriobacteriia bacterium]